jgi:hypothetical protein
MLISDSHAFIFVQMRKVASSSMQEVLKPLAVTRPAGILAHWLSRARLQTDYRKNVFRTHDDMLSAKRLMPAEKFDRYFKFSFVRNPWERLVSEYEYILATPEHGRHERVARLDGFEDFIKMQIPRGNAYQLNMLCDKEGRLLTDFVGKLENLDEDWRSVCSRLGIRYQALRKNNVTRRKHYLDYFDKESSRLVARYWRREIELFAYGFDA